MTGDYFALLRLLAPEAIVALTALIVLGADLMRGGRQPLPLRMSAGAWITVIGCALAFFIPAPGAAASALATGVFTSNPLIHIAKQIILLLTAATAILSISGRFTNHAGEYFSLLLFSTLGMLFLVSADNLLMVFLALELTSLCLYVLTAFDKRSVASAEAALKYFLFGGVSAAFLLFGFSLIYGVTGEIQLTAIASSLQKSNGHDSLIMAALVMVAIGFGFKVAIAPFHLWAPDTYQGAPTPCAAFIASGSKVASFFILARLAFTALVPSAGNGEWARFTPGWMPVLALCAALSMILGNVAAIAQSSVKRLLAYSAIAHAGYMMLGVIAGGYTGKTAQAITPLLFYVSTYALTTLATFGVVMVVECDQGHDRLDSFAGLRSRSPLLALCMLIFLLSLAGIPPLAGFFGKFYLFTAIVGAAPNDLGLLWLVILAIAASAVSLYYYLQILKQIYVADSPTGTSELTVPASVTAMAVFSAVAILLLGCAPNILIDPFAAAVRLAGF
ncbi:MAG: NADH-quinone oxidoreductase subunit N [Pedosphaera sp.]|nr:NADH-quinone oxidoreductase subunit N [Pedosphaera sp.]